MEEIRAKDFLLFLKEDEPLDIRNPVQLKEFNRLYIGDEVMMRSIRVSDLVDDLHKIKKMCQGFLSSATSEGSAFEVQGEADCEASPVPLQVVPLMLSDLPLAPIRVPLPQSNVVEADDSSPRKRKEEKEEKRKKEEEKEERERKRKRSSDEPPCSQPQGGGGLLLFLAPLRKRGGPKDLVRLLSGHPPKRGSGDVPG